MLCHYYLGCQLVKMGIMSELFVKLGFVSVDKEGNANLWHIQYLCAASAGEERSTENTHRTL